MRSSAPSWRPWSPPCSPSACSARAPALGPQLGGTLLPYANQEVRILRKTCGACTWRAVTSVKTNDSGVLHDPHLRPRRGRWKGRSKVNHSNGCGNTKGRVWPLYFA